LARRCSLLRHAGWERRGCGHILVLGNTDFSIARLCLQVFMPIAQNGARPGASSLWLLSVGIFVFSAAASGGGYCESDLDCQLNGICSAEKLCTCDVAWRGANCSVLNLLPAKLNSGFGSMNSSSSSWGGQVQHDPKTGKWVMHVAEMGHQCGLGTWGHEQPVRPR
jgi:hypothetical protein